MQDNDDALAAILRAGASAHATASNPTKAAWWKKPDEDLGSHGQTRLHFNELARLDPTDALSEIRRLAGK